MRSINKLILVGNVGVDPEVRVTVNGHNLAKFSVATTEQWTDKTTGNKDEKTQWHRCTAFGKLADIIEKWVHKGDRIYIEGALEYSQTEDRNGNKRYWTDVIIKDMVMLGSSGNSRNVSGDSGSSYGGGGGYAGSPQAARHQSSQGHPAVHPSSTGEDDLPF